MVTMHHAHPVHMHWMHVLTPCICTAGLLAPRRTVRGVTALQQQPVAPLARAYRLSRTRLQRATPLQVWLPFNKSLLLLVTTNLELARENPERCAIRLTLTS